jgi:hypothetical protein
MNLTSRALAGTRVVTLVDGFSSASVCAELLASFGADLSTVDPTTTGPADVVILDQSGLAGLADHGPGRPRAGPANAVAGGDGHRPADPVRGVVGPGRQ